MGKRLFLIIAPLAVLTFVYLHFEYFPGRVGPDLETAQADVNEWAQKVSRQSNCSLRVTKVHPADDAGIAVAEVDVRYLYYEDRGIAQRYVGRAEVGFVRTGRFLRPSWNIRKVTLLDEQKTLVLN
jgi:hypothetical protein